MKREAPLHKRVFLLFVSCCVLFCSVFMPIRMELALKLFGPLDHHLLTKVDLPPGSCVDEVQKLFAFNRGEQLSEE